VLARWITDRDLPKRFDVPFLVARVPPEQTPVADETEQFEPVWVRPADALARHQAGSFFMIYPTIITLERLQDLATVDAVLHACACRKSRCGPVARAPGCWLGARRAIWRTSRPTVNWRWCARTGKSCTRWTGNASRPCHCSKTCCA